MFRRRSTLPILLRVRHFLWPRTGWLRAVNYYWHRLQRIPGTPASIAAGFACGVGVSFTPLVGLHTAMAVALAWALRSSLLAGFFGTLVVNPWTAPPVWLSTYYVGVMMLPGVEGVDHGMHRFVTMFVSLTRAVLHLDWTLFVENVWPMFLPMLVGGVPMGLTAGIVTYYLLEPTIRAVQTRRAAKRAEARARNLASALTVPPSIERP